MGFETKLFPGETCWCTKERGMCAVAITCAAGLFLTVNTDVCVAAFLPGSEPWIRGSYQSGASCKSQAELLFPTLVRFEFQ